jgi:hypothetical protein
MRCDCTRQTSIDKYGYHIISGCNKGAHRVTLHNAIMHELNTMMKCAGAHTALEERGAFHAIDPDDHRRPDITIFVDNKVIRTDVSITSPVPLSDEKSLSLKDALTPDRASNAAKLHKDASYKNDVLAIGSRFEALIFETTGRPHALVEKIVMDMCEKAAHALKTRWDVIYRYWMCRIATTFQYHVANGILLRTRKISRNQWNSVSPLDIIEDHCRINPFNPSVTRHLGSGGIATPSDAQGFI